MKEEASIEIAVRPFNSAINDEHFMRHLHIRPIAAQLSPIQMWILKVKHPMRFSLVNHIFISKNFHAIAIFKLVCLRVQFFIKLFFVTIIFRQFPLLEFN